MSRRSLATVAAALLLVGGAVAGLFVFGVWTDPSADPRPSPIASDTSTPTPEPIPTVLSAASSSPVPGAPSLAEVLGPSLTARALGDRLGVSVVDLSTGAVRYEIDAGVAMVPASTLKILTAAAGLEVLGPDHTFTTRVVGDAATGDLVLVGGGDPTLTVDDQPALPSATRLATLADATAAALLTAGTTTVRLAADDGLFTGPAVDPDWRSTYIPAGVVAPVTALAVDGGRRDPDADRRSADPTLAAAASFAAMLSGRGITVSGEPGRGDTVAGAAELASMESPPLSTIVEHILSTSDNDGAEVLARHVARGTGQQATSAAAGPAVLGAIAGLGVDVSAAVVTDGSGLARNNAVPASALAATLAVAADPEHPELRTVLTGLPVAGFTGTLGDRFESPSAAGSAGVVRAKTGTLTGVSSLAGIVVARDGTAYAFALLADDVTNTLAARSALDDVATALAGCGCSVPGPDPTPDPAASTPSTS